MSGELSPQEPGLASGDLPGTGGRIGPEPAHFRVSERALYEPSGSGEHVYVRLEKRSMTTPDLVQLVSRQAKVRERDIGYAGLKDKHAVTEQWLSLPSAALPPEQWHLPETVRVLAATRHKNKLRTGHLLGNDFAITLVELPHGGVERARAIAARLRERGLPNYFGAQRFGREGRNLAEAADWFSVDARESGRNRRVRFKQKLYASVIQSEVFNRYLTRRTELGLHRLLCGEVVRLSGSGSHFIVEDRDKEQPRLDSGDIVLTGPMFGPKGLSARGEAGELEQAALSELGLSAQQLSAVASEAPGTRRDLVLAREEASVDHPSPGELVLRFSLPAGSFATQWVREFTRAPWLATRGQKDAS